MGTKSQRAKVDLSAILWIAVLGGLLSITLHELLHIVLHLGQITSVHFFPNFYTVFEVTIDVPDGYDLAAEEFLAYMVSAVVLLVAAGAITHIYDRADTRSVQQLLFPDTMAAKAASKPATRQTTLKRPAAPRKK